MLSPVRRAENFGGRDNGRREQEGTAKGASPPKRRADRERRSPAAAFVSPSPAPQAELSSGHSDKFSTVTLRGRAVARIGRRGRKERGEAVVGRRSESASPSAEGSSPAAVDATINRAVTRRELKGNVEGQGERQSDG